MQRYKLKIEDREIIYDIDKAISLVNVNNLRPFDINSISNQFKNIQIDKRSAMSTDINKPILIIEFYGSHLVIDGWHRLYKCWIMGIEQISCYLLTPDDETAITLK